MFRVSSMIGLALAFALTAAAGCKDSNPNYISFDAATTPTNDARSDTMIDAPGSDGGVGDVGHSDATQDLAAGGDTGTADAVADLASDAGNDGGGDAGDTDDGTASDAEAGQ